MSASRKASKRRFSKGAVSHSVSTGLGEFQLGKVLAVRKAWQPNVETLWELHHHWLAALL
jgi:hypothetical protein